MNWNSVCMISKRVEGKRGICKCISILCYSIVLYLFVCLVNWLMWEDSTMLRERERERCAVTADIGRRCSWCCNSTHQLISTYTLFQQPWCEAACIPLVLDVMDGDPTLHSLMFLPNQHSARKTTNK